MTYMTPNYNRLLTVTDPLGHTTSFSYDSERRGNVISVTNPLSKSTSMTYDTRGLLQSVTDPLNHTTTFSYEDGGLVGTTDALGRTTTRFTDALGRMLTATSALNTKTQYEYDLVNQLTKVTDALNGLTTFTYDANGNLLTLKDAKTQTTTYTYDNMDRVATRKDPLLKTESYLYDANSNLTKLTDRKAQITNYTYDTINRRTKATFHDGTSINYTYDTGNRLTQIQEKNAAGTVTATITRTYDNLDRLTREVTPQGTIDYTYDTAGRRTSMTVTGQVPVTYTYDNANRLTSLTQGTSIVSFTYDDTNRRTSVSYPNSNGLDYGYDAANQLTSLTYKAGATILGTLTYTYDKAGNRTIQGGTWARAALPPALTTASYTANNQPTAFGSNTLVSDANGNLASVTEASSTATYTWNVRNQLTALTAPGFTASFTYDALGRRTGKTVQGITTNFVYDGLNSVQEKNGASVTANLLTGLSIDEFLTRTDASGTKALLPDALGSTIALDDGTGSLSTQYTYEPFGATVQLGQPSPTSYHYTGREEDGTGLYYYRARYYSPRLQRFLSEDHLGFRGGNVNLYGYVLNNPMRFADPFGLKPKDHFAIETQAALDAIEYANNQSRRIEHGGYIYQNWDKPFSYTYNSGEARRVELIPPPGGIDPTAAWHTHPEGGTPGFTPYADLSDGLRNYLGLPDGNGVLLYDPAIGWPPFPIR